MRRTLARIIRRARPAWDFVVVESAEAALEALKTRNFDVVLTDLTMPGVGGRRLLEELKLHHPETLAVIYSAQIEIQRQHPARQLAFRILIKPASTEALLDALDAALSASSGRRGPTDSAR